MHVKAVTALAPHQRAIIARVLAIRAARVERHPTNTAIVVVGDPLPNGNARVAIYLYKPIKFATKEVITKKTTF